jgi:hypothetical protein
VSRDTRLVASDPNPTWRPSALGAREDLSTSESELVVLTRSVRPPPAVDELVATGSHQAARPIARPTTRPARDHRIGSSPRAAAPAPAVHTLTSPAGWPAGVAGRVARG